ncbi:hypothetical protein PYW08_011074 [Mythimna loreyi]|uniref:Uncharacterized protein n=1 Tax=Mythimna loreyi TaxID=667449 RepID=A0ACC2Q2K3_9NEOP|nr:hypothetical protein PYW08_011074 [Mythimna loreyi]
MVHFPVRKCYQAAKLALLVVLVVTVLAMFEQWRGGKKNTKAEYSDPREAEYERQILEDESRIIPGLGEGGAAAHLIGEEKKLGEESEKKLAINVYLSDRIPYNRTLKDFRNPACKRVVYDAELPSASVILIFHNEPYSVVVRTIWSVVNSARRDQPWYKHANFVDRKTGRFMTTGYPGQDPSSQFVYLKEIILVDDNSTLPELKGKLSHYVRTRLPPDLIRILRLPDRMGLTRARLAGARYAAGDVIVFLDSHCEGQPDWMRPLLQTIKDYPHAVVVPIIDVIEASNFYYSVLDPSIFQIPSVRVLLEAVRPGTITYIMSNDKQGLMLARLKGARTARGDVLIFLDAHCEGGTDWMRPLLERVKHKRDAVVTPIIDVINQSTFEFEAPETYQVGGFSFMGHFTWTDVPEREKKRRGSDIAPTWSPTMAGGLFAISRAYFWELGAYDEQMGGWGGENLEMSFRIWQCGGTLETIPCSRVGHVFRSFHPYGMPAHMDTHGINTARMAEVWMDEYAELFYLHRPDLRNNPKIGDVTHRKILREKLKCKSFQWYLDNIYKEKFVPVRDVYGYGRFKNEETSMCLDTLQRENDSPPLGCYPCHSELQATQYFSLSLAGELRDEFNCATVKSARKSPNDITSEESKVVVMMPCHGNGREQKWRRLSTGQLQHAASQLCLTAPQDIGDVRAAPCRSDARHQTWTIDYTEDNNFHAKDLRFGPEREQRLNRLRGQRRISRSLLSYAEPSAPEDARKYADNLNVTERRHTHKKPHHKRHGRKRAHSSKKHVKNKFILRLQRTLMNGTDEHLEVDIHCKHQQLYPNNSFVRDLVTILNDKNVKVINNGRVFERNKVTELNPEKPERVLNKMDIDKPRAPERARGKTKDFTREGLPKHRLKKLKHVEPPPAVVSEDGGPGPGPGGPDDKPRGAPWGAPPNNKLVIEDFVDTKNLDDLAPPPPKKHPLRKRKHRRPVSPPPPPAPPSPRPPAAPSPPPPPAPTDDDYAREALQKQLMFKLGQDIGSAPRDSHEAPIAPEVSDRNAGNVDGGNVEPVYNEGGRAEGRQSVENLLDDSMDRSAGREDWTIGESRFRSVPHRRSEVTSHSGEKAPPSQDQRIAPPAERHESAAVASKHREGAARSSHSGKTPRRRHKSRKEFDDSKDETAGHWQAPGGAAPVKVVMKSNLTFNLGDEFFSWKNKATDDLVNDFLGELSIPTNNITESLHADTKRSQSDAHAPAHVPAHAPALAPAHSGQHSASHSDSSSDSSGD